MSEFPLRDVNQRVANHTRHSIAIAGSILASSGIFAVATAEAATPRPNDKITQDCGAVASKGFGINLDVNHEVMDTFENSGVQIDEFDLLSDSNNSHSFTDGCFGYESKTVTNNLRTHERVNYKTASKSVESSDFELARTRSTKSITPTQVMYKIVSDVAKNAHFPIKDFGPKNLNLQAAKINRNEELIQGLCNPKDPANPQLRQILDKGTTEYQYMTTCYANIQETVPGKEVYKAPLLNGVLPAQSQLNFLGKKIAFTSHISSKRFGLPYSITATKNEAAVRYSRITEASSRKVNSSRQLAKITLTPGHKPLLAWYKKS